MREADGGEFGQNGVLNARDWAARVLTVNPVASDFVQERRRVREREPCSSRIRRLSEN